MSRLPKISYKLIAVFIGLLIILVIGSLISMKILLNSVNESVSDLSQKFSRHYALIMGDTDPDLWDDIYIGAALEGEKYGVYVENFGEELTVDYSRDELIDIAIDADVDGIIIDGDADNNTVKLINKAKAAGIPVVTVMDDCVESDRISFVGIGSYAMGRQFGEEILKNISGEDTIVYVMLDLDHASSGQDLAISGISDVLAESKYADRCSVEGIYVDNSTAFGAEEDIRDIFFNEQMPDVLVALNSVYTRCLFQAAVDYNKVGEVSIYGFNDSQEILEAVSKDIVQATLSVDTYKMGAAAVEALEEYLNTGYVSEYISLDTQMILSEQAKERLDVEDASE